MTLPSLFQSHATQRPPPPGPRHDALHMADGLRYCWCMCPRCFIRYGDGHGGICCCRQCPCEASYLATIPIYIPHRAPAGE